MSKLKRTVNFGLLNIQRGFTLIELMIVLVILSVLLFVAVPNYDSVIAGSEVDKARLNLATGLALARTEAVKRGEDITLCRGSSGTCGINTGNVAWTGLGWKVLVASDNEIIRVDDSANNKVNILYNCGDFVSYGSVGTRSSNTGTGECEYTFTNERSPNVSKFLCIAATGRVRMSDAVCN